MTNRSRSLFRPIVPRAAEPKRIMRSGRAAVTTREMMSFNTLEDTDRRASGRRDFRPALGTCGLRLRVLLVRCNDNSLVYCHGWTEPILSDPCERRNSRQPFEPRRSRLPLHYDHILMIVPAARMM